MHTPSTKRTGKRLSVALFAALLTLLTFSGIALAQDTIVQTYFVPVDEDDALDSLRSINTASIEPVRSYLSIAVGANGTKIYYDHWEDGFQPNFMTDGIKGSATGATTEIWGDGICANGYPPNKNGVTAGACNTGWDTLSGGDVIVPLSNVGGSGSSISSTERNVIDFDGGDMIASTEQIAFSRVYWSAGSNTLSAAAFEVYPTSEWGTLYRAPVGENTSGDSGQFSYTALSIQAMVDGTVVSVDRNNGGTTNDATCNLDKGESCVVDDINQGATVTSNANRPVQVQMLTGEPGSNYSYSGYTLLPVSAFSNDYWAPVSRVSSSYPVRAFFFNAGSSLISVRCEFSGSSGVNVDVAGGSTAYIEIPNDSTGEHCFTRMGTGSSSNNNYNPNGGNFFAVVMHDTDRDYDWGITMVPAAKLDKQVLIGIGLGRDPTVSTNPNENGSPIWVTPVDNTCFFVDANGDGWMDNITNPNSSRYNVANRTAGSHGDGLSRDALTSSRFFHTNDGNQTGMQIFSRARNSNGSCPTFASSNPGADFVAAWGEDPGVASVGEPGFDVGVTNPNMRAFSVAKSYQIADGGVTVQPGDKITYTVRLRNTGFGSITSVVMRDILPSELNNSTSVVKFTRYNTSNTAVSSFTATSGEKNDFFGSGGLTINIPTKLATGPLAKGEYIDAVFSVTVNGTAGELACNSSIVNQAIVTVDGDKSDTATVYTPCVGQLTIIKKIVGPTGETFTFNPSTNLNDDQNFTLSPATNNGSAEKVFVNLPINQVYGASENTPPTGWTLQSVACLSTIPSGFNPTYTSNSFSLTLRDQENVTCTFTNVINTGKLEVKKALVPSSDSGLFNLSIDGGFGNFYDYTVNNVGNNGTTGERTVAVGSYTIGETAGTATNLANYNSSWECRGNNGTGSVVASGSGTGGSVNVTSGSDIVCVITNVRPLVRINIDPNDTNAVGYTHTHIATVEGSVDGGSTWSPIGGASVNWTVTNVTGTPTNDPCNTNTQGKCAVSFVSSTAQVSAISAVATGTYQSKSFNVSTGTAGNGANATKTWVDLRISVTPNTDTNPVNAPHTFTALVESKTGGGAWTPVNNAAVAWSVSPTPSSVGTTTCNTNSSGTCTFIINSNAAGVFTVNASTTHAVVAGQPLTRATSGDPANLANNGSGPATKTYVNLRISVTPQTDTNKVGDAHTFTAKVEQQIGNGGWSAVSGASVAWTVSPLPSTNGTSPCTTNSSGQCNFTINSSTAGVFNVNASTTVTVSGQSITRSTDGDAANISAGGTDGAQKTYVNLRIRVTPLTDSNPLNALHTFTAKVEQQIGNGDWTNVNGASVAWTVTPTPTTTGTATCTTAGAGECTLTINSNAPGVFTANASTTVTVSGQSITRSTSSDPLNIAADGSGPATKNYVTARISITPNGTNAVGYAHTFTVKVEKNDGTGWTNASGVIVNGMLSGAGSITDGTCGSGPTNASGVCTIIVNSSLSGVSTVNATADVPVNGLNIGVATNGAGGNSGPAVKTWVDLRILITPQNDTNPLNQAHVFTATVQSKTGNGSWVAVNNAPVTWTVAPTPSTVGTANCNTNSSGQCTFTINSNTAGTFIVNASTTVAVVAGEPLTRSTSGDTHNISVNGSDAAQKDYVDSEVVITKTVIPAFTREYAWEITKTVNGPLNLFDGETGNFTWTITTTKTTRENRDYKISGAVNIKNNGTLPITVNAVQDVVSGAAYTNPLGAGVLNCGSLPANIAAGGTLVCTYSNVPVSALASLNTVTATLSTGEKAVGSQSIIWGEPTTKLNDIVDVVDTNAAKTWNDKSTGFSDTYTTTANCVNTQHMEYGAYVDGKMTATQLNTADVKRDGTSVILDSDDATATLNCYRPSVTKTAATTYDRTWDWNITKTVNKDNLVLTQPATEIITYTVKTTRGASTDDNWAVSGKITVNNPHPSASAVVKLSDSIFNGGSLLHANLTLTNCTTAPVSGNYTIPAGSSLVCDYSRGLGDPSGQTLENRATITQTFGMVNKTYTGTAPITFGQPTNEYNATSVNVTDIMTRTPGNVNTTNLNNVVMTNGQERKYTHDACAGMYDANGNVVNYDLDNTARIIQNGKTATEHVDIQCIPFGQLQVQKTVNASYQQPYSWDVDKRVSEDVHLFDGQTTGVFTWTVQVTKTALAPTNYVISGTATIVNNGPGSVTVNSIVDKTNLGTTVNLTCLKGVTPFTSGVLLNGESLNCTYPNTTVASTTASNKITVTTSSGVYGTTQPFTFVEKKVNDSVYVYDDGAPFNGNQVSSSTTFPTYTTSDLGCDAIQVTWTAWDTDAGTRTGSISNTASLKYKTTDSTPFDSDTAIGDITCYRLKVNKTANPTLTRTWDWTIEKEVSTNEITATYPITGKLWYTVTVTRGNSTDSNWAVTGNVNVVNPAPMAATLTSLTDDLSGTPLTLTCPGGETTVAANSTKTCTYSTGLPNGTTRTNTATAVAYGKNYTGTATVDFDAAIITKINENNVDVTDRMSDTLTANTPTQTFTDMEDGEEGNYQVDVCESIDYGTNQTVSYTINNRATIDQNGKSDKESVLVHCTKNPSVTVQKTVNETFTRAYTWEVKKTVSPAVTELFDGQEAELTWTIEYTKSAPADSAFAIAGNIIVHNGSTFPVTVDEVVDELSDGTDITLNCPTLPAVVQPGGDLTCTYTHNFGGNSAPVGITNVATATLSSGVEVVGSEAVTFGDPTTVLGNEAQLDDDQYPDGDFTPKTSSGEETYKTEVGCEAFTTDDYVGGKASDTVVNTAILTWSPSGEDESTATAAYNCYRLAVTKTANPTLTRTWDWEIEKEVSTNAITLTYPVTGTLVYTVSVNRVEPPVDSDWKVSGNITVHNPAPMPATLTSVADAISDFSPDPLVNCSTLEVPAKSGDTNGSLTCTYPVTSLPDGATRTNTATAVAYGKSYTGTASVNFTGAVITSVNENSVDVTDTMTATNEIRNFPGMEDGDKENYQVDVCENLDWTGQSRIDYVLVNTARIDQPSNDSDTETVDVTCLRPDKISVEKTFIGTYDVDFDWEVTKTVNSPLNLFVGETGTFTWTIDVEKSDPIYSGLPKWRVDITNSDSIATMVEVYDSIEGLECPQLVPARAVEPGVLVPGNSTVTCYLTGTAFSEVSALPTIPVNTVIVTTTNGFTATDSVQGDWGAPLEVTDNVVDIVDSNGMTWNDVSDDTSFPVEYTEDEVGCFSEDVTWNQDWNQETGIGSGSRNNVVQVRTNESEFTVLDQDDATGIVNCYDIVVTPSCVADAPVLSWVLSGPDAAGKSLTLEWMNGSGGGATVLPGGSIPGLASSGDILWLGANTTDGNIGSTGVQWPGWTQNPDGSWTFAPNSVNPNGFVRFSFNPTSAIQTVAYPPSDPTCSTAPRAVVGDRVWIDTNGNGVQDGGESGYPNATVEIYQQGNDSPYASTTTDANGIYTFTVVGGFNYYVKFYPPYGYVFAPQDQGGNNNTDSDPNTSTGNTASFNVPAGGIDRSWDAGLLGPNVIVEKVTTGKDPAGVSHTGDGITIDYAKSVTWTYVITNPGPAPLMIMDLFDDKLEDSEAQITCEGFDLANDVLLVGESVTCTATGIADEIGYNNTITVTAVVPDSKITVTDSDPSSYVCVGNELTGIWYYEANGVDGYQAQGDFLFKDAPDNLVPANLKNLELPIFLSENGVPESEGGIVLVSKQGGFQFSDLDTAAVYTLRVGDDVLMPFGYAVVESSLRFNITPTNCNTLHYEIGYRLDGPVVGDFVWYDTNRNGLQDEWFDADNDNQVTLNNPPNAELDENGYVTLPLGDFEFIDLNANGIADLEGEMNKCGLRSVGPELELLDENGNILDTTIAGNSGYYRFRSYGENDTPLDANSVYGIRMQPAVPGNPKLLQGALDMASTGLCKPLPAAADASVAAATAAEAPAKPAGSIEQVCSITTDNTLVRDLSDYAEGIALDYDFGIQCQPLSGEEPSSSLGDFVWQDTNRDGIQNPGEPGVANVLVQLYQVVDGVGVLVDEVRTNANGNYLFTGLDAGTYYLQLVLPNGVVVSPRDQGASDSLDSDIDPTGRTNNITLADDQEDLTWDFGIYVAPTNDPDAPEPDLDGLDKKQWLPVIGGGF